MSTIGESLFGALYMIVRETLVTGSITSLCRCLLVFAILLAAAMTLQCQSVPSKPAATIEANVQEVVVDVVVAPKGEALPALTASDFQVFEDGKPQVIASFREHKAADPTRLKLPQMPAGVFSNIPDVAVADSVNVLIIDTLNTPIQDQVFVRQQMLKYLKTIPPGARLAVFTLTTQLRLVQGFATDSTALLAALNDPSIANPRSSPLLQSQAEQQAREDLINFKREVSLDRVDTTQALREFLAETSAGLTESRVSLTLIAMQQLARHLSVFPGRKNVIWLSGFFPIAFVPDEFAYSLTTSRSFHNEVEKTAHLLAKAQIAVYPVSAEGLAAPATFQADARRIASTRDIPAGAAPWNSVAARWTMDQLAKGTGGQAFYNTNGLQEAVTHATNVGMRYYTITYVPSNAKHDGKYRHISLEVAGKKTSLSYRRGYYALDEKQLHEQESKPESDPLLPLVSFTVPDISQILFKVRVLPTNPQPAAGAPLVGANKDLKGRVTRYDLDFAVAVDDLVFDVDKDGNRYGKFYVRVVAYDPTGKPLNAIRGRREIKLDVPGYTDAKKVGLQLRGQIDVPSGIDSHLRLGIYDLNSGRAGTLALKISNPVLAGKSK